MKTYNLTESQNSVLEILDFNRGRFPEQFLASLDKGDLKIVDNISILRKQVDSKGGQQQLVNSNTLKVVGISDFDKNRLSDDEALIVEQIRVGYAKDTNADQEAVLKYQTAMSNNYRNSTLRIIQKGNVLFEAPMSDLTNKYTGNSVSDDYLTLKNPFVLAGGAPFKFEIEFHEDAQADATNKEYFELVFKGQKAIRSSK